jgi:hypothetical protein
MGINTVSFSLFSAKEINELYQKSIPTTLQLKFRENPIPISYTQDEFGYVGVVALRDYYDFITDEEGKIKEQIFESNVRHYQGNVDVNNKIQNTINNDYDRDFWWLNNGVTIIASSCRPIPKSLFLDEVQIVNGLQTSFTIANHYNIAKQDNRSVLIKVVISKEKATIDKIISASNSQTPVSAAVLRATDDIQRTIELYFLTKGFFYDRRKNFYKNKGKPSSKIFSIQNTAQAIESIINLNPAYARSSPTSLLKEEKSYKAIFRDNIDFQAYLNCCIIVQKCKNFINTALDRDNKGTSRNFLYHLARIVASESSKKPKYTAHDIEKTCCDEIRPEDIGRCYIFMNEVIAKYQQNNPKDNVINISKSKKFVDVVNQEIDKKYKI